MAIQLNSQDKEFLKLTEAGDRPSPAFRKAYPDHDAVLKWNQSDAGSPDHQKAAEAIKQAAKHKLGTKYMQKALVTYQDSMERFSELSVATAIDLVANARSEKVRADLAIEGMRHKVGTPVTKVAVQEKKVVILQFDVPESERAMVHATATEVRDEISAELDDGIDFSSD